MAKKETKALHALNDDQIKQLRSGIEKIEKLEERSAQLNADKRAEYERLVNLVEPLGYEKGDLTFLVSRRKKDRDRTVEKDRRVHRLEAALGMATADLFDEAQNTMKTAASGADVTAASLAAGNAVPEKPKKNSKAKDNNQPAVEAAQEATPEPSHPNPETMKDEGRAAWARGAQETECKYEVGSEAHAFWITGWNEAQADWQSENAEVNPALPHNPAETLPPKLTGAEYRAAIGADL